MNYIKIKGGSTLSKQPRQTTEIRIMFKDCVNEGTARKLLDGLEFLRYQTKRTDGRKKSLVKLSVLVPPSTAEDVIKKLNAQEEIVSAEKIQKGKKQ